VAAALLPSIDGRSEAMPLCPKEVPRITLENISPPYKDYDYFTNHRFYPSAGPFRHVGALKTIDHQTDRVQDGGGLGRESGPDSCDGGAPAAGRSGGDARYDTAVLIPGAIRDHVPLLYAILLWNTLVAGSPP
jgi:hypothetical protein